MTELEEKEFNRKFDSWLDSEYDKYCEAEFDKYCQTLEQEKPKQLTQADFYPQYLPYGNVSEFCDHVVCNMCGSHGYVEQGVDNCPKCGEYGYLMDVEDANQAIDRE